MVIDDDDDEEDDGEIKQDSRIRRSVSVSSGPAQDGSAKKSSSSQEQDHAEVHKCMDCGKIYKHPNCLWKHRWLHSVYWKSATKFLLSKHQQVQLMEAAAILLGMDESRDGDKDPIVSMFSKQRGALVNSIGSSASTMSDSPPISTKSLSRSPPPQSERTTANRSMERMSEIQHTDIQMLTALRNGHAAERRASSSTPFTAKTATVVEPGAGTGTSSGSGSGPTTQEAIKTPATKTSPSSSPSNSKSATSSSSSTPPTLTADDESLPEVDEDMSTVTPPSMQSPGTVRVAEKGSIVQSQQPQLLRQPKQQQHFRAEENGLRFSPYYHQTAR
ncbi:hypothetical protein BG011_010250 [Mortierella polycephala]|uniref:C2H2-type domain-containing protein n=1 Tax=Mortierella polycephala TaxID=41804 RepID=A0A9P6QB07_9FUNG|nr:hypothetical protein BG011_010250 [Mortierella polycephala]